MRLRLVLVRTEQESMRNDSRHRAEDFDPVVNHVSEPKGRGDGPFSERERQKRTFAADSPVAARNPCSSSQSLMRASVSGPHFEIKNTRP